MVSVVWALIAGSGGLLAYLLPAAFGPLYSQPVRTRIGAYYYRMTGRALRQYAIVRRILGGFELLPIKVDDEHKHAKVTLSSGVISSDRDLPFTDPDNRIKRLYSKPVALVNEGIPAVVDAELAELGHWKHQHEIEHGLETTTPTTNGDGEADLDNVTINPYITMTDDLRLVDPQDVTHLTAKNIEPDNNETAIQLTKQRYQKYGSRIGAAETLATLFGFAVGAGGIALLQYLRENIIDGSAGGTDVTVPFTHLDPLVLVDLLRVVL